MSHPRESHGATGEGALSARMGIEYIELTPQRVVARMPVDGNTQPYGLLHGGASCVLAETVASIGSALYAGPERFAVGTELNASHHRSATSGYVTAVAVQLHSGRSTATYDVAVTDDRDQRICTARVTCMLRDKIPSP
ncbi:aromatic compound degradation protein PaaI [Mycolicibacterium mucogenicum]|uniref:Aromatic compound degradation protein PaaI n=1 Tax=Mycolicibacterium mucogenicum TaxID=56689 RepID=A0A1A3HAY0_MYCMU|nr:hotdog fold thioesterase [Mycolicibacterium mucogenicum]OBJ44829.1 aromatic compound degradation protein PaaI [Mycolicibacterium mucogenicum]